MVDAVRGSVVYVSSASKGSGFIYDTSGQKVYIVTAAEIVGDNPEASLTFDSGAVIDGTVVGKDEGTGIAVVEAETDFNVTILSRGDADQVDAGEYVCALKGHSRTDMRTELSFAVSSNASLARISGDTVYNAQVVSFDGETGTAFVGGPLVDVSGAAVGMVLSGIQGGDAVRSYAVGINDISKAADEIIAEGAVSRGALEITASNVNELASYQKNERGMSLDQTEGIIVNSVSGNARDNLKEDDVITKINGTEITNIADLRTFLYTAKSGDELTLTVIRSGEEETVTVIAA